MKTAILSSLLTALVIPLAANANCEAPVVSVASVMAKAHLEGDGRMFVNVKETKLVREDIGTAIYSVQLSLSGDVNETYHVEANKRTCKVVSAQLQ